MIHHNCSFFKNLILNIGESQEKKEKKQQATNWLSKKSEAVILSIVEEKKAEAHHRRHCLDKQVFPEYFNQYYYNY